jgi:hypothetical protein
VANEHRGSVPELQMMLPRSMIAYLCPIHTLRGLEHIYIVVLDPDLAKPPSIMAESDVNSQNVFLRFHSNQAYRWHYGRGSLVALVTTVTSQRGTSMAIVEHGGSTMRGCAIFALLAMTAITAPAFGQRKGSLREQKTCYDQAMKYVQDHGGEFYAAHYDPKSQICYVRHVWLSNGEVTNDVVNDAYEGRSLAGWSAQHCYVKDIRCSENTHEEFNKLLSKAYPDLF